MSATSVSPPPPPAVIYGGVHHTPSQYSSTPSSSSIVTVITIIVATVIISASIYLLLRYLSRRIQPSFSAEDGSAVPVRAASSNQQQRHLAPRDLIDSLPLFTFSSITPSVPAGGDCAVCLSKFEQHDQLRLLPLCCHAFHAACIDTWIASNQTCPLCRSTVLPSGALDKILSPENRGKISNGGGSFRIEIGNISRCHAGLPETETAESEQQRRSYSVGGAFEYIVGEDDALEVSVGHTTHSSRLSDMDSNDKSAVDVSMPPGEVLDAEVSSGRNRLRECVDRLASISSSSRTNSLRSSGRFFSGSSRRSEAAAIVDLEAYRAGEEISEIFRWLSGV